MEEAWCDRWIRELKRDDPWKYFWLYIVYGAWLEARWRWDWILDRSGYDTEGNLVGIRTGVAREEKS